MRTSYEVVECRVYIRDDGKRASFHGARPWTSDEEQNRWVVRTVGWTVYNLTSGAYGIGRRPWRTREEAQAWVDTRDPALLPA